MAFERIIYSIRNQLSKSVEDKLHLKSQSDQKYSKWYCCCRVSSLCLKELKISIIKLAYRRNLKDAIKDNLQFFEM
jgi:hypothetical protein